MAKIAVAVKQALARRAVDGSPGNLARRGLAQGDGWTVDDVVCTSGPQDRLFEERHSCVSVAIVAAGSFQYRAQCRSGVACELMTPGSLLLGNASQSFECSHDHGSGDRCLAFRYSPDYFESLASDAGGRGAKPLFPLLRVPPLPELSSLVAHACSGLAGADISWEELSIKLAARAIQLVHGVSSKPSSAPPSAVARVTRAVRKIERHFADGLTLNSLAREAGLSRYHFLRTFEQLTGITPHQFVLRARLREAAMRLSSESTKIIDIAVNCGFGDVSNFNRAFRTEFGRTPRAYRNQIR